MKCRLLMELARRRIRQTAVPAQLTSCRRMTPRRDPLTLQQLRRCAAAPQSQFSKPVGEGGFITDTEDTQRPLRQTGQLNLTCNPRSAISFCPALYLSAMLAADVEADRPDSLRSSAAESPGIATTLDSSCPMREARTANCEAGGKGSFGTACSAGRAAGRPLLPGTSTPWPPKALLLGCRAPCSNMEQSPDVAAGWLCFCSAGAASMSYASPSGIMHTAAAASRPAGSGWDLRR